MSASVYQLSKGEIKLKFNLVLPTSLLVLLGNSFGLGVAVAQTSQQTPPKTSPADVEAAKQKLGSIMAASNMRMTTQAPSNFPVQPYKSNVTQTTFINSTKGSPVANLSICTKDSPETVFQWYQQALKAAGWTLRIPSAKLMAKLGSQGQLFMLDAEKEQQGIKLMCILDKATNGTTVTVGWLKNR